MNLFWVFLCASRSQKILLRSSIEMCSLKTLSVNADKMPLPLLQHQTEVFFLDHPETKQETEVNLELTIWLPERGTLDQHDSEALYMDQCLTHALLEDNILMLCGTYCISASWSFWRKENPWHITTVPSQPCPVLADVSAHFPALSPRF